MDKRKMQKADFITSIVLITVGLTITIMSLKMPRLEEKGIDPFSAPGVVPGSLGVIITFMAVILFIRSVRQKGYSLQLNLENLKKIIVSSSSLRLIITVFLCLFYALVLMGRVPYLISTFLFTASFILLFELKFDSADEPVKKILFKGLIQSVLVSVIVAASFRYLFLVDLP